MKLFTSILFLLLSAVLVKAEPVQLRIIQITDVYTLVNFPSLKNLIRDKTLENGKTVSMLTGDFMMPYLLSRVDQGRGMMKLINALELDYLTWGNHENDMEHQYLMERVREYEGVFINSNMLDHESYTTAPPNKHNDVETIALQNGNHTRTVSMLGILTDHPSLLPPGAFNNATIGDPWETMHHYNKKLKSEGVDLVLPLCHLYEVEDERTASELDFPVILGGHDHHVVHREINGTLLLKPGADSEYAVVLDLIWDSEEQSGVTIKYEIVDVAGYSPDQKLQDMVEEAYGALDPLKGTQIATVPSKFRPLTSIGARSNPISMATYMCTEVKKALVKQFGRCDAFLLKGGNMRGSQDYSGDKHFTLEGLRSEFDDTEVYLTQVPGNVLRVALRETWSTAGTGWFQHDDQIEVDNDGFVVGINGGRLDEDKMYTVASMKNFFRARDSPALGAWFEGNPQLYNPYTTGPKEGHKVHAVLLRYFSEVALDDIMGEVESRSNGTLSEVQIIARLEMDGDGKLTRKDMFAALNMIGFETHDEEFTFVDFILSAVRERALMSHGRGVVMVGSSQNLTTFGLSRQARHGTIPAIPSPSLHVTQTGSSMI